MSKAMTNTSLERIYFADYMACVADPFYAVTSLIHGAIHVGVVKIIFQVLHGGHSAK